MTHQSDRPDQLDLLIHAQAIEERARRAVEQAQTEYVAAQRAQRNRGRVRLMLAFIVVMLIGPTVWLLTTYAHHVFAVTTLLGFLTVAAWYLYGPGYRQTLPPGVQRELRARRQERAERRRRQAAADRYRGSAAHVREAGRRCGRQRRCTRTR